MIYIMTNSVWDYVIDGLFVIFIVNIITGVAASGNAFNALLYGMFAGSTEQSLAAINTTSQWKTTLTSTLNTGANTLSQVNTAAANVFPLAVYISVFVLFIGAVLGIVVMSIRLINEARAQAIPVRPV